jgi:nitroreductase
MNTDLMRPSGEPGAIRAALYNAVTVATLAPSLFNSQPWRWVIHDDRAELRADRSRRIAAVDPHGRLLVVSCGAAPRHAVIDLAGVGYRTTVERLPGPADPDLLARIVVDGAGDPDAYAAALSRQAWHRHTDRRPFGALRISAVDLADLVRAAADQRVGVHELTGEAVDFLATAAAGAATIEARDPAHRRVLGTWVGADRGGGDGVPLSTVPATPANRPVPLRDLAAGTVGGRLDTGPGDDTGASSLVIPTRDDGPADWLAAGETASAVPLTAAQRGLGTSPMSEVVEVPGAVP